MNKIDELKLAIYESVLDDSDKNILIDIVESTDDEEVLNKVSDTVERSYKTKKESDTLDSVDVKEIENDINEYKEELKDIKKLIKGKKFSDAKNATKKAKEKLVDIKKAISRVPLSIDVRKQQILDKALHGAFTSLAVDLIFASLNDDGINVKKTGSSAAIYAATNATYEYLKGWKVDMIRQINQEIKRLDKLEKKIEKKISVK